MKPFGAGPRILIVEDEPSIVDTIQFPLETDGCITESCGTGGEALSLLAKDRFDLVVLDVGLPDMTGFEVCRRIRTTSNVPILFLTARSEEIDRVVGLEIGGDDYVSKPFRPRELSARIRAILRRASIEPAPLNLTVPTDSASSGLAGSRHSEAEAEARERSTERALSIDQQRKVVLYFGERLTLSRYEFRLLEILAGAPGRVYSRSQLMEAAWEEPEASMERTVDAHIKSLRSKLRQVRPEIDAIRTHRGFGYSLFEEL
ncbi:MAG: two-component system response regulator CreB [Verrucomicrobia bacterium]|nr:two-component system response regulator CreB [Verrucomicrobiota bacterium]MBV8278023.1 two-component system response regulator CreB [Verrucomicrobiota bacterium]